MTISTLAAAYLFFGGVGAGTLFFAVLAGRKGVTSSIVPFASTQPSCSMVSRISTRGMAVGLVMLAIGVICLVFDLGRPNLALLLFVNPTWSFMTVGAYLLVALMLLSGLLLAITACGCEYRFGVALMVLRAMTLVCAVGVMAYTGLLLRDLRPIALWTSLWLPVLFVASSLAGGASLILLASGIVDELPVIAGAMLEKFARLDLVLVLVEVLTCALFFWQVTATPLGAQGVEALLVGRWSALFWGGFVLCGLAMPGLLDVFSLVRREKMRPATALVAALCSVAGCFCLRMVLVLAGTHVMA